MRKKTTLPFLLLFSVLLLLMTRSKWTSDQIRGATATFFSPLWQWMTPAEKENTDALKLQIENQLLRAEIDRMQQLLKEAFYLKKDIRRLVDAEKAFEPSLHDLKHILKRRLEAIPARVIYRASASWNSFLWLDVGSATNETLQTGIIAVNSPVVVGNSLVGVIDYVGKHQARVRLITDTGLFPSVRSARGRPQGARLVETINVLIDNLTDQQTLLDPPLQTENLIAQLEALQKVLDQQKQTLYLAKGELQGSSLPHKRSHGNLLKGSGFNCDFADEKGPARDLRNGTPCGNWPDRRPISLLKPHDILITTGMDGLFPEGLHVGEVVSVTPLEEGSYFYELQAKPTAGNLDTLTLVFVMAPQGFDPEDCRVNEHL